MIISGAVRIDNMPFLNYVSMTVFIIFL